MSSWSFKGTAFRRMEPDGQARDWPAELQVTVDIVADSPTTPPRRYVDIGAVQHDPWSFRAGCDTQAARDALASYAYKSGTLVTAAGATYQALCVRATPVVHDGGTFYADLKFVML